MQLFALDMYNDGGNHRMFVFAVEQQRAKGWAKLRLMAVNDTLPPRIEFYRPDVHDGGSHYMSNLWTARRKRTPEGNYTYALQGAFGEPRSQFVLHEI
jgi:hypothetical protein